MTLTDIIILNAKDVVSYDASNLSTILLTASVLIALSSLPFLLFELLFERKPYGFVLAGISAVCFFIALFLPLNATTTKQYTIKVPYDAPHSEVIDNWSIEEEVVRDTDGIIYQATRKETE